MHPGQGGGGGEYSTIVVKMYHTLYQHNNWLFIIHCHAHIGEYINICIDKILSQYIIKEHLNIIQYMQSKLDRKYASLLA